MPNNNQKTAETDPRQILKKSADDLQLIWDDFSKVWSQANQQISTEQAIKYIKQTEAVWYLAILPYLENENEEIKDYAKFNNDVALSVIDYLEKYIPKADLDKIKKISFNIKDLIIKTFRIKKNYEGQEYQDEMKKLNEEVDILIQELSLAGHTPDKNIKEQVLELNIKLKTLLEKQ